jgi:hypothetical protein
MSVEETIGWEIVTSGRSRADKMISSKNAHENFGAPRKSEDIVEIVSNRSSPFEADDRESAIS